jgi:hypothetical protein
MRSVHSGCGEGPEGGCALRIAGLRVYEPSNNGEADEAGASDGASPLNSVLGGQSGAVTLEGE